MNAAEESPNSTQPNRLGVATLCNVHKVFFPRAHSVGLFFSRFFSEVLTSTFLSLLVLASMAFASNLISPSSALAQSTTLPTGSLTMPLEGSSIFNRASVTYFSQSAVEQQQVFSNAVEIKVAAVQGLTLTENQNILVNPGVEFRFAHILMNTGNTASAYTVGVDVGGVASVLEAGSLKIYLDENGNGIVDANETALSVSQTGGSYTFSFPVLPPGNMGQFIIVGKVAGGATVGQSLDLAVSASTIAAAGETPVTVTNTDRVTVSTGATLGVLKSALPSPMQGELAVGASVRYVVSSTNSASAVAAPIDRAVLQKSYTLNNGTSEGPISGSQSYVIKVNGTDTSLVLLRDLIPQGMNYKTASLVSSTPGATLLYRYAGEAPFSYRTDGSFPNVVEVAVGVASLNGGAKLAMEFETTVRSDYAGSFYNTAEQFYMGVGATEDAKRGPTVSNTVAHIVSPLGKPDLTVSKTHTRNFGLGMEEQFTIMASNVGQWATTGPLTVTDNFPVHMVYLGAQGVDWTCPAATGSYVSSITCSYSAILNGTTSGAGNGAVGQPTTPLTIKVRVLDAALPAGQDVANLTNKVVVAGGGEGMATLGNNTAEDTVEVERLSSVAGRVWLDQNTDRIFQSTEPTLAGWKAQLILIEFVSVSTGANVTSSVYAANEGQVVTANATETTFNVPDGTKPVIRDILTSNITLADGKYIITGVRPRANYALRFISPTGAVFSLPVNGEQGTPTSTALISPDLGSLMVLTLNPGQNVIEQSLPLAPMGVVYDLVTRAPVPGAIVRLIPPAGVGFNPDIHLVGGPDAISVTTDANGYYQFRLGSNAPRGLYTLEVTPAPGYAGVSWSVPPEGAKAVAGDSLTSLKIQEQFTTPSPAQATTYHLSFNWAGQANYIVNNHIPLEKPTTEVTGALILKKEASKQQVEVVDFVDYTVTLTNQTNVAVFDISVVDTPAFGFSYLPGSAYWVLASGEKVSSAPDMVKQANGSYQMRFNLRRNTPLLLAKQGEGAQTMTLHYRMSVTPAALQGDGVNIAIAHVTVPAKLSSAAAKATVKVTGGVFAEEAFLIGKVFLDCNKSGTQEAGELGIPGVRLFLQDGSFVITDNEGKYSIYGLKPQTHVLKVDMVTLPQGSEIGAIDNRSSALAWTGSGGANQASRSQTRFIDLKKGELHKGNFAVNTCSPAIKIEVENRRSSSAKNARTETQALVANAERFKTDTQAAAQNPVSALTNTRNNSESVAPSSGMIDLASGKAKDQVQTPTIAANNMATSAAAQENELDKTQGIELKQKTDDLVLSAKAPFTVVPGLNVDKLSFTNIHTPLESLLESETSNELGFLNLRDDQKIAFPQTSVQVRGVLDTKLELRVNGQSVSESRVGKRSKVAAKYIEAWEYVAVDLEVGENTLDLIAMDAMGNERGRRSIKIYTPGKLANLKFESLGNYVADGRTSQVVRLSLSDDAGVPVMVRTPVTLMGRNVEWAEVDLDPREEGVQIFVQGGKADLLLGPKVSAGEVYLLANADEVKTEHKLVYIGELRPLVAVGVVEGTLRFSDKFLSGVEPVRSTDPFERELTEFARTNSSGKASAAARAAFFIKGKVLGKYLLTAAYDSEKQKEDALFRDIKPDAFYPIYGDSSTRGFDAQSSGRLYVRIDKERSYLLLGDFSTAGDGARQLTNYSRALNGLKVQADEALSQDGKTRVVADGYVAKGTQTKVTAPEIQGTGLTGPFSIDGIQNRLDNSEVVEVLVRDRLRPGVILSTSTLTRFADYTIDALTNQLRLIQPLASVDANGNPQYLRVSYEAQRGGTEFYTFGGSAQVQTPVLEQGALSVGVAAQVNKDPAKPTQAAGLFAEVKVNGNISLQAEVAKSIVKPGNGIDDSAPKVGQANKEGSAARVQANFKQGALQATASAVQASKDYDNLSSSGATAGQRSLKLDISYALTSSTALTAQGLYTKDSIQNTVQQGVTVGVKQSLGPFANLEVGARRYENKTLGATLANPDGSTSVGTKVEEGDTLIAKLSARAPFAPNLNTQVEWEQDTSDAKKRRLSAGLDYKVGIGRLYAKHEWINSLGNSYSLNNESSTRRSTLGFSADYSTNGSVYGEYRIPDAIDAKPAQAALGVKQKLAIGQDWNLALQAERTQPTGKLSDADIAGGSTAANAPEKSTALSAALEYIGNPDLRYTQRLEWRKTQNEQQLNLLLAGAYHLDKDWSLLARYVQERREVDAGDSSGDRYNLLRLQIGAAFRPVDLDEFNALAKLEVAQNKDRVQGASTQTDSVVASVHANWQPVRRLTLNGRYAVKLAKVLSADGASSDRMSAQLLYGRASYDLTDRVDVSLQAFGMLAKGGTKQYGLGVEAGYLVHANLWLSMGYNFSGFVASDLASDLALQRGGYLRLRMKFDENGW